MIKDMVTQGSPNYKIIYSLVQKRAELIGTESPELLIKEYEFIKKGRSTSNNEFNQLLNKRDEFIASQINNSLGEGKTGLLFIGAKHNLAAFLAPDIQVTNVTT